MKQKLQNLRWNGMKMKQNKKFLFGTRWNNFKRTIMKMKYYLGSDANNDTEMNIKNGTKREHCEIWNTKF